MTSEFNIAIHALVYLNHKQAVCSSEVLAENVCANAARIRKVMAKLKKAGIVKTKEGIDGGYLLQYKAENLYLDQIAAALQITFISSAWRSGDPHLACLIASGMADVMSDLYDDLNGCCKERLKHISIADLDRKIFHL